ncbi:MULTISPECIES: hypothetical protein [Aquimarina]|uniref:Lipoprotein n=1 Tax=Aquimarina algiphila TaxID=2047982 RepID=A0A554VLE9_9FLAO|nr:MULTISPECIES: hypothetical protein [Aquimarina]TSE08927.1 hypothetical protein FOF46_10680 [Aquimarina algiphila]
MKNTSLIIYTLSLLFAVSCGVPQEEFDRLKKENENLKQKIAECQLTPHQILEQANEYYDNLDYTKSRDRLKALVEKFPNSSEGKKGKKLLKKVEKEILANAEALEKEDQKEGNNEAYQKALSNMKKKYDVANEVTWYSDNSSTQSNDKSYIQTYIGKKEKRKPWLGLSINHFTKKDWLFIQRMEIDVDGKTFEIEEATPGEFNSKEESGGKREWLDRVIKELDMPMIKAIASSKVAKIKFVGKDDLNTKTISKAEKKAIQNVLDAYNALLNVK